MALTITDRIARLIRRAKTEEEAARIAAQWSVALEGFTVAEMEAKYASEKEYRQLLKKGPVQ